MAIEMALAVLDRNWSEAETIALTGRETWRALRDLAAAGVGGGHLYDG